MAPEGLSFSTADSSVAPEISLLFSQAIAYSLGTAKPVVPDSQFVDKLRRRLDAPGTVVVVGKRGDTCVACCFGQPLRLADGQVSEVEAHLSLVAVAPSYWGQGYGTVLMQFAEESFEVAGYIRAQLHVLQANTRARNLYERCGWSFLGAGEPHEDGPQVVYGKQFAAGPQPSEGSAIGAC
ncbi:GNAT family N-acetyltransferase [Actinopolymorpha pittospori]|uniref:Ribosomal protein S18 acetylase RimI-like enzyme n=1 Tax=Actinopolymorpha pittospori TaxID=648752 RepID=A0A927MX13_9ACTN|nr:ribosomal protein S18 acetylase RimI-like enzyme [Actinopolymorpha pittospori]